MNEVFFPLASSNHHDAVQAQVPVNALRCLMNIVAGGGSGEGMMVYHRMMPKAADTILTTIKVRLNYSRRGRKEKAPEKGGAGTRETRATKIISHICFFCLSCLSSYFLTY